MAEPILPQLPTDERVEVDSVEWLFTPDWPGERLLARVRAGDARLSDASGAEVSDRPEVAALLGRAVRATRATLDGTWTASPFLDDEGEQHERHAYVATDLLEVDGEPLLDVPFQERHRLLESVIEEGLQVRVGPVVKQPVAGWLAGWRRLGFTHVLARHQNARYRPGERANDFLRVPIESAPAGGLLRRVVGGGRGAPRRIRD
jgi:bifunctional non-homologous end joining protein LigD